MNKQLQRLITIAEKKERLIVGLMSGTSLDGLDIALCTCDSKDIELRQFKTIEYDSLLRNKLSSICSKVQVSLSEITRQHTVLAHFYATQILATLNEWEIKPGDIDLIASHGQTIYHQPQDRPKNTLQIVDGDHIAQQTGIITISDFRQKHVAAGGEGAPLAALMDERLYRDQYVNRMLLNLGGIANFTWLPSFKKGDSCLTSDTGPANTLINEAMQKYFDQPFDHEGTVAAKGTVDRQLLKYLLLEPYFRKSFPKTTGQEVFNLKLVEELMLSHRIELNPTDLIATLTQLTVQSITRAFDEITGEAPFELYISGGGIHNEVLMESLKERLTKAEVKPIQDLGIHPDAKEAVLMAFLANEMISGNTFKIGNSRVSLGKISLPG